MEQPGGRRARHTRGEGRGRGAHTPGQAVTSGTHF
jgi:hypothetical protein